MWRYLAVSTGSIILAAAGYLLLTGQSPRPSQMPLAPGVAAGAITGLPDSVPEASAKTREEKRFSRYDKDKDGAITRDEYLSSRKKAYVRLDTDGDGRLSFDEWAIKTTTRFAAADANRNGAMDPVEFATTAPKRAVRRGTPACVCPPVAPVRDDDS